MVRLFILLTLLSGTAYPCEQEPMPNKLKRMVNLINKERKAKGLHALKVDPKLNCAAQMHSDDIGPKRLCQHEGTDGSSPWDRAERCGTRAFAENVACGQGTPRQAVDGWLNSPGHYKNMMNEKLEFIGLGVNNNFWTNIFR